MSIKSDKNIRICVSMWRIIIVLVIVFFVDFTGKLFLVSNAEGLEQTRGFMEISQTDKREVSSGIWGGTGINLLVEEKGGKLEFDCAEAEIGEKLMIDKNGKFSVEGSYKRRSSGALRIGFEPKSQPATFIGKISDKKMTLKITLTESEEEIGDYTLEHGKEARIHKCL